MQREFAELITKYMERQKFSDSTLAERLNIKRETIFRWRRGGIKSPKCKTVEKCVEILGLNSIERNELLTAARCPDRNAKPQMPQLEEQNSMINKSISHQTQENGSPLVPVTTRPIIQPAQFFGREEALKRIFNAWGQIPLEHIAIIGPPKSGKTSLLNYLRYVHNHNTLRNGKHPHWFERKYNWVFVDFEKRQMHRPESFLRYLLKELDLADDKNDLDELMERFEEHLKEPTVILMDDIEKSLELPELDDRFWGYMRYLGNHIEQLGYCVTSRYSLGELEKLAEAQGKSSPLANVFSEIEIGPLIEEEARELLSYASLSETDVKWILRQSQCWPVLLQLLCKIRLDMGDGKSWQTEGLEKIKRYEHLLSKE